MITVKVTSGDFVFEGVLELKEAPRTCAWFQSQLPFRSQVVHARWSGEAVWIPMGDTQSGLGAENHTIHPSRGDMLFYPGGVSEAEILLVYGSSTFASRVGPLPGNHFLTLVAGHERLHDFGNYVLWHGAQDIEFVTAD